LGGAGADAFVQAWLCQSSSPKQAPTSSAVSSDQVMAKTFPVASRDSNPSAQVAAVIRDVLVIWGRREGVVLAGD